MAKYFVVQGSVGLGAGEVKLGNSVELTESQAAGLIASGFVVDEKTFAGLKKMVEGALEAGAPLQSRERKLAQALGLKKGPVAVAVEDSDEKPEPKKK